MRRSLVSWTIAGTLHALLLAYALQPVHRSEPAPAASPAIEEAPEITLDLPAPVPSAPSEVGEAVEAPHAALATRAVARAIASAAPAGPSGDAPSAEVIAGANSDWIVNVGPTATSRGLVAPANPFLTRPPASADFEVAKRKDTSLANALRAQDMAKGLGPDGPVLHALEDATRASLAPIHGNATFRALVDATGIVTSLSLIGCEGDHAGWNDAREHALAALAAQKLQLHGAGGAELDIMVASDLRLPSGARVGDLSQKRVVLSLDPSDIGQRPIRVVHARVTGFKLL